MATWGLHMRIAEKILKKGYDFDDESFLVGNIGPDCGIPNEDWSAFTPPSDVTHWSKGGKSNIDAEAFYNSYLDKDVEDEKEKSFLVGYYVHLLTDIEFSKFYQYKKENDENYSQLKTDKKFIWTIKKDWYDLDHLYFRENPNSIFYTVFQHIKEFPNYLSYYPEGAVIRQVKYITEFYQKSYDDLDREYIYLTIDEMNNFVQKTTELIINILNKKGV